MLGTVREGDEARRNRTYVLMASADTRSRRQACTDTLVTSGCGTRNGAGRDRAVLFQQSPVPVGGPGVLAAASRDRKRAGRQDLGCPRRCRRQPADLAAGRAQGGGHRCICRPHRPARTQGPRISIPDLGGHVDACKGRGRHPHGSAAAPPSGVVTAPRSRAATARVPLPGADVVHLGSKEIGEPAARPGRPPPLRVLEGLFHAGQEVIGPGPARAGRVQRAGAARRDASCTAGRPAPDRSTMRARHSSRTSSSLTRALQGSLGRLR